MNRLEHSSALESKIIAGASAGDEEAFAALFRRYYGMVLLTVKRCIPPAHHDDVLQSIFIGAYRCLPAYRKEAPFGCWLAAIARNRCCDWWRSQKRSREIACGELGYDGDILLPALKRLSLEAHQDREWDRDLRENLRSALTFLAALDRRILELRYLGGHSVEETARILNLSPANVKVRSFRAARRLRVLLSERAEEERRAAA